MKPLAPVRNTVCGTALLLILDHFLQSLQVGLDFLGGVLNLHGVVYGIVVRIGAVGRRA